VFDLGLNSLYNNKA